MCVPRALVHTHTHVSHRHTHSTLRQLSDHTRTRWGRRRPWILAAALPTAIFHSLLWQTPDISNKFLYYATVYVALNASLACSMVPYTSLTPEIAPRYDDSTSLTSLRFFFGIVSGLVSLIAFLMLVNSYGSSLQEGYSLAGILFALFGAAPSVLVFATVPERSSVAKVSLPSKPWRTTLRNLWSLARNRSFVTVCLIYMLCWITTNTIQTNLTMCALSSLLVCVAQLTLRTVTCAMCCTSRITSWAS